MFKKRNAKIGSAPGTLFIPKLAPEPRIKVIRYDLEGVIEEEIDDVEKLNKALIEGDITWIDIQGFGDKSVMHRIGEIFSLHPLILSDVVNVPQRPKADDYDEQLLIILRMVHGWNDGVVDSEQVSIVVGKNYVITFQEKYGDVFDPVRKRIRSGKGIIRKHGPDYLAYAIADTIIDGYYPMLETIGEQLEGLEDDVVTDPKPELLRQLNQIKNQLVNLRRSIWPQREAMNSIVRGDHDAVTLSVQVYFRDTYDHCVQTSEVAEMYREMVTGLMNTYLSSISNRTNEVMKVLTIMASVFIPLTFVAGVYGMNFEHMPELHMKWAYPTVWAVMLGLSGGMFGYFWRKGWLS